VCAGLTGETETDHGNTCCSDTYVYTNPSVNTSLGTTNLPSAPNQQGFCSVDYFETLVNGSGTNHYSGTVNAVMSAVKVSGPLCGADKKEPGISRARACHILISKAIENGQSGRNLRGRYYCVNEGDTPDHYDFALRYHVTPDEPDGNDLVGDYHVDRSTGNVSRVAAAAPTPSPVTRARCR